LAEVQGRGLGHFGALAAAAFQKGIDIDGVDAAVDMPYDISEFSSSICTSQPPAADGFWRGVGPNNNVFAVECMMDDWLARPARTRSISPLHARRALGSWRAQHGGGEKRLGARNCRRAPVAAFCLQPSFASLSRPSSKPRSISKGGSVDATESCRWSTPESPSIPTPSIAHLKGDLIFGLTAALYGEITIDKGRVQQSNFHDYRMLADRPDPEDRGACREKAASRPRHRPKPVPMPGHRPCACDLCRDRASRCGGCRSTVRCWPRGRKHERRCANSPQPRVIALIAVGIAVWVIRGPGPLALPTVESGACGLPRAQSGRRSASLAKGKRLWSAGEYLAKAADCMVCHTAPGAKEYTGRARFKRAVRRALFDHITPDKETGIGNYSDQDFLNAVQRGKRTTAHGFIRRCRNASYTYMSMRMRWRSRPICQPATGARSHAANTLTFPFNQRWGMMFWSALFQSGHALHAGYLEERNESRCVSRRSAGPFGASATPAQPRLCADNRQKFCGAP